MVYNPLEYDRFWILFKNLDDYKMYRIKFHNDFAGGIFLLQNGWVKQRYCGTEETNWATEELGDDFLYDHNTQVSSQKTSHNLGLGI